MPMSFAVFLSILRLQRSQKAVARMTKARILRAGASGDGFALEIGPKTARKRPRTLFRAGKPGRSSASRGQKPISRRETAWNLLVEAAIVVKPGTASAEQNNPLPGESH